MGGNDAGSRVLYHLELMEGLLLETIEERFAVVQVGGDEAVYKDRGEVGGEGRVESFYVTEMEVG